MIKGWAKQKSGFTIVELLIVVIVIAILATITIVGFNGVQNRAKQSAAASAASQSSKQLGLWQVENANRSPTQAELVTIMQGITGTTFEYTPGADGAYCITATTSGVSYQYSNSATSPQGGSCYGHSQGGVAVITNLIPNPSFEANTSAWTTSGNSSASYPTTGGYSGPRYYQLARTANAAIAFYSAVLPVEGGEQYTSSLWVRIPSGRQALTRFQWYDASNMGISTATVSTVTSNGDWRRYSQTENAPVNARFARVDIVMNTTSSAVGDTLAIDAAMLTKGPTLYGYADGSTQGWQWQGEPHVTVSSGLAQ